MSTEKQIRELASDIEQTGMIDSLCRCRIVAEELYFRGYRKQRTAVWVTTTDTVDGLNERHTHRCTACSYFYKTICPRGDDYCHKCGAEMKGGE